MSRQFANLSSDNRLHAFLWAVVGIVFVWSYIGCADPLTWALEVFPVVVGTAILGAYYRYFHFTRLVCWLMAMHAVILMIGGHYTYAEVPLFNWIRDTWHLSRNHYDRVGHFMQGFVPAMIAREVLLRRGVVRKGGWLNFIVVSICLAISAAYELLEWQAAVWSGTKADAFLSTQGDVWDTQKDMTLAAIGAITALATLSSWHGRQMRGQGKEAPVRRPDEGAPR